MSRLNVDEIKDYDGNKFITMDDNDIEIGIEDEKIICFTSLVPENSDSCDLTRPATYIVNSGTTTVNSTAGASFNTVYLVPTDIERSIILPSSVPVDSWITITDIGSGATNSGNASKKNITIRPQTPSRIQGGGEGEYFIMDIDAQSVTLYYVDDTYDWRLVGS
jgi:hypothetical protein